MTATTDAPAPATTRGLNRLDAVTAHMREVLARGGADMSQLGVPDRRADDDEGEVWDKITVPKARAAQAAWRNSMVDAAHEEYLRFRFKDLDPNQSPDKLQQWLDSLVAAKRSGGRPSHLNAIMPGNVGSGKTTALTALGNEAADLGLRVLFLKHATYLTWRRPDSAPHDLTTHQVRAKFITCDLLILDELCGEMDTVASEFARRETIDLVDARIAAGRPTAYSTNLHRCRTKERPIPGIAEILGARFLSRLEDSAYLVPVVGPDRRKPAKELDW
ncbi:ATP-binding protein [Streptomyces griseomycini]|uniref:DNA replication protein DnaC n=1 Tax=Streptomyces griseomycini TaxID=66895 RepID=A0A7W7PWC9_9ACTN|nr:ATP-binding protein [Streptomyces griseomycini]MBB4902494.1 DNA replication protein DnaC [Streptomyces griseomycini]GGR52036.1 hypothetical protein GCM10015536_66860 [Streptomyces griseomycini]